MKRSRWNSDDEDDIERDQGRHSKTSDRRDEYHDDRIADLSSAQTISARQPSNASTQEIIMSATNNVRQGRPSCRGVDNYARIGKIDEGTYGVVSKARDKATGDIVALKQIKMSVDLCKEGFPVTALRETNILLALDHPNIIRMREMVVGSTPDKIYMVMDYANNDLKGVLERKATANHPFLQSEIKTLLQQLLRAMDYMHSKWYIHRDLKSSNLLYDHGVLKVCDFGMARKYGSPIRTYTHLVVTLWYRAPELLLGAPTYSTAVDMWSVGCIFAELILLKPLLPGRGEIDQLDHIFKLLGAPTEANWPGVSKLPNVVNVKWKGPKHSQLRQKFPVASLTYGQSVLSNAGFDLMQQMLSLDPAQRISAADALKHEYFSEAPPPKPLELMPTFP
jgi:cell division cycle 2-like protein